MLDPPKTASGEVANFSIGLRTLRKIVAFFVKFESFTVEAVPSTRWWWAVWEDVTQMGPAASTANFGPHHAMRFVLNLHDVTFGKRTIKRRPAGSTGELTCGLE